MELYGNDVICPREMATKQTVETSHIGPPLQIKMEPGAELPSYGSSLASGFDIKAMLLADGKPWVAGLAPAHQIKIATGLSFAIPAGYELQIRSRSGLAANNGIVVLNSPGTIDADYRGQLSIVLYNHGLEMFEITHGMKIAQAVLCPVYHAQFKIVQTLSETTRGSGGFGSTGV